MPHFVALRSAYVGLTNYLRDNAAQTILGEDVANLYRQHFELNAFPTNKAKSKPQYRVEEYPSLFDALPLLPQGTSMANESLPTEWPENGDWTKVTAAVAGSPIAQLLLAFIWKQGDLHKVSHVLRGLNRTGGDAADGVMYQFGRHLSDPLREPIFDQHTYRAYRLVEEIEAWPDRRTFNKCFGGKGGIPKSDALPKSALSDYLVWWNESIEQGLPATIAHPQRIEAILWMDRLLFSLGKAAKLQTSEGALPG